MISCRNYDQNFSDYRNYLVYNPDRCLDLTSYYMLKLESWLLISVNLIIYKFNNHYIKFNSEHGYKTALKRFAHIL